MSGNVYGPTPRINSSLLSKYAGQNVRIVGKVLQNDGKMCVLEASDRGEVRVSMPAGVTISATYMELIGKVNDDGSVKALTCMDMGDDFDLDVADKIVQFGQTQKGEGVLA